jgi:hypothetical protein
MRTLTYHFQSCNELRHNLVKKFGSSVETLAADDDTSNVCLSAYILTSNVLIVISLYMCV